MAGQGINLISESERFAYEPVAGVKIIYRRAPDRLKAQWIERYKKSDVTGLPDFDAIGRAAIEYGVISWDGVTDPETGECPAKVTPENVLRLPKWVVDELSERINSIRRGLSESPLAVSQVGSTSS